MIQTLKIEIFISESEKDLKNEYYKKLYDYRYAARKAANITAAHLFMLDSSIPYLNEDDKNNLSFLGAKGKEASKGNAPYVVLSNEFKGKVDMRMISSVIQSVKGNYSKEFKEVMIGNRSLRSYKNNIPIPFQPEGMINFSEKEYLNGNGEKRSGIFFNIYGIPFQMKFGKDRSGNRNVVRRILSGELKMKTSSIQIVKKEGCEQKIFLLLCVDMPQKSNKLIEDKKMFVQLGVMQPATVELATGIFNCTLENNNGIITVFEIGSAQEFNYKRRQISEGLKRLQIDCTYNKGGNGRKRKLAPLERYKEKEINYVEQKAHLYSRKIVDLSIKNQCSEIVLINQDKREEKAKKASKKKNSECDNNELTQKFIFRNWSWHGLIDKITYKAKQNGISVIKL